MPGEQVSRLAAVPAAGAALVVDGLVVRNETRGVEHDPGPLHGGTAVAGGCRVSGARGQVVGAPLNGVHDGLQQRTAQRGQLGANGREEAAEPDAEGRRVHHRANANGQLNARRGSGRGCANGERLREVPVELARQLAVPKRRARL